jgi:hypothetical protein
MNRAIAKKKPTLWSLRGVKVTAKWRRANTAFKMTVLRQDTESRSTAFVYRNRDNMERCRIWSEKLTNAQSTCRHSDSTATLTETRELTYTTVHRSFCKSYYLRRYTKTINELRLVNRKQAAILDNLLVSKQPPYNSIWYAIYGRSIMYKWQCGNRL